MLQLAAHLFQGEERKCIKFYHVIESYFLSVLRGLAHNQTGFFKLLRQPNHFICKIVLEHPVTGKFSIAIIKISKKKHSEKKGKLLAFVFGSEISITGSLNIKENSIKL